MFIFIYFFFTFTAFKHMNPTLKIIKYKFNIISTWRREIQVETVKNLLAHIQPEKTTTENCLNSCDPLIWCRFISSLHYFHFRAIFQGIQRFNTGRYSDCVIECIQNLLFYSPLSVKLLIFKLSLCNPLWMLCDDVDNNT